MAKESKGYKRKNVNVRKIALWSSKDFREKYYLTLKLTGAWFYSKWAGIGFQVYSKPYKFLFDWPALEHYSACNSGCACLHVVRRAGALLSTYTWCLWSFSTLFSGLLVLPSPHTTCMVIPRVPEFSPGRTCPRLVLFTSTHSLTSQKRVLQQTPSMPVWFAAIRSSSSVAC